MPGGFAALPPTVERLLAGTPGGLPQALLGDAPERIDRVAVVLLDAFGMRFVERHADHPLLRGLRIAPLASQFPSTTTAHVTTMHPGTPVGAHGLYEWNVYEPALDAVIIPILYARAGGAPDGLRGCGVEIGDIVPPGTLYERLADGGRALGRAAPVRVLALDLRLGRARAAPSCGPFATIADGAAGLAAALEEPRLRLPVLARDRRDRPPRGAGLARVRRRLPAGARRAARRARAAGPPAARPVHGRPRPGRRRPLPGRLPRGLPAARSTATWRTRPRARRATSSCTRAPAWRPSWRASCGSGWRGRAEVVQVAELEARGLFGEVGPRLRARLADVCVLPAAGRMAWLRSAASVEQRFRGHHGGLDPAECETWLGVMVRT